ncbi:MAG TPA: hypothetical protein VN426_07500 [Syntrophomonadaceae bacterium]|nr:hypothetical protein [Syntrophomonadaceae bacterium]
MGRKFVLYGFIGWVAEILFTGFGSLIQRSLSLPAKTYLWMFPIYGLAFLLEPLHDQIRSAPWPVRGFIWASLILGMEYSSGWILQLIIGVCPWDYSGQSRFVVDGFIRLDYIPVWFMAGLLFEQIHDQMDRILIRIDR